MGEGTRGTRNRATQVEIKCGITIPAHCSHLSYAHFSFSNRTGDAGTVVKAKKSDFHENSAVSFIPFAVRSLCWDAGTVKLKNLSFHEEKRI
jgi:hypothetical protein